MLTIYDTANEIRFQTPINIGSKRVKELMGSDYVLLKFSVSKPIYFQLGDWCDVPGNGRFELVELYNPTYNKATGGYDYELELEAYYCKWRNKIFKYTPESGGREASWSLTATLDVHLGVFVRNLKALGYLFNEQEFIYAIDETVVQSAKLLTYNNTDMITALNMMAEAWDCEWWVEDHVIYFGRCELGTPIDFEQGVNVDNISPSGNKNVYATRIYAFGSTRNIPVNYRPTDESIVVNGIVQKRLMLPAGTPYVDAYPNMPTEAAVERVVVFDDVYPRTNGNVDSVSTYTDTVTNDDGETNTETFYRFKDSSIKFSKDYILENEELHIIFQSGSMNGLDFGVMFNPLGLSEKLPDGSWNPDAQLWEVVANEDYGRKLPDTVLMPKAGDKYVLYGWDATKIASLGLIDTAEQELLEKTNEYIVKTKIDPNSYPCTMMSDWMKEQGQTPTGYYFPFGLGDRVNLISDAYFFDGSRQSRIIGYEYPLDYPYDSPVITVGETKSTSRLGALEDTIESLTLKGQTFVGGRSGGGGSTIYLITTNDTTTPTNRNAFSALRSLKEFLSKTKADRTPYKLSSDIGFEAGNYMAGVSGGMLGIDAEGDSFAEVARLYVRVKAFFEELTIVKANVLAGKQYITPGGGIKCVKVEEVKDVNGNVTAYRCYFLSEQDGEKTYARMMAQDQAICEQFNVEPGTSQKVSNRYYWRLVTAVVNDAYTDEETGNHYGYVELSKRVCASYSDIPEAGDEICQLGYQGSDNNKERRTAMVFSTVDADSPSMKLFSGIDSFSLADKAVISFGRDAVTGKIYFRLGSSSATQYLDYRQGEGLVVAGSISSKSTYVDDSGKEENLGTVLSDRITDTDVLYIQTESRTDSPKTPLVDASGNITDWRGWNTEAPEWKAGKYIWQTTYVKKGDGGVTFSQPVCISGRDATPVTITEQSVKYSTEHTATQPADPTFTLDKVPADLNPGDYLWSRTEVNYSNGEPTVSYAVSRIGVNGDAGSSYSPNLLKNANVKLGSANYRIGGYKWDNRPVAGTRCTLTICAKVGALDDTIGIFQNHGFDKIGETASKTEIVKSFSFTVADNTDALSTDIDFYHVPNDGRFDVWNTYVKWAVVTVGDNVATEWVPSASEMTAPTIVSTVVTYAATKNNKQPADSDFTATSIDALNIGLGEYLWSKTVVSYSDGSETKSYGVSRIGSDGDTQVAGLHIAYGTDIEGSLPNPTKVIDFATSMQPGIVYEYIGIYTDDKEEDSEDFKKYEWSKFKGDPGTPAKIVVVNSDATAFVYSDNFATLVGPTAINLSATLQGTTGYQWSYKKEGATSFANVSGGTASSLSVSPANTTYFPTGAKTCTFRCTSGGVYDEVTIVKVSSGTNGINGNDAYTVLLTNESHIFEGDTEKAIAGSTESSVIAYKGATQVAATIGTITGMPTGMTVTVGNNGTKTAKFTVTVANTLTTKQGTLNVPVTVDGKTFTQVFSWSLSLEGNGIDRIEEEYCLSDSSSTPTPNVWYDEDHKPTWVAGKYMWTRSHVYYTDGTDDIFGEVCVTGATGTSVLAQYSATGGSNDSEWHPAYMAGDVWMRTGTDGVNWSPAVRILASDYANNILLKSDDPVTTNSYLAKKYDTDEDLEADVDYTVTIWGNLGSGKEYFGMWFNGGSVKLCELKKIEDGVYSGHGKVPAGTSIKRLRQVDVYQVPSSVNATSRIDKIKMERGVTSNPQWTPAASEMIGKDGPWRKFQWAVHTSSTSAADIAESSWKDTPMTAPAGQYVWMRSGLVTPPATEPTSYDPATRITGDKGEKGDTAYRLDLTDEVKGIACDALGNPIPSSIPTSSASVWKGAVKVNPSNISFSIAQATGVTATVNDSTGLVSFSNLTADSATVVVQAVLDGVTLQANVSIYKVRPGNGYAPNLIRFTKNMSGWGTDYPTNVGFSYETDSDGFTVVTQNIKTGGGSNNAYWWLWNTDVKRQRLIENPNDVLVPGKKYTLSFEFISSPAGHPVGGYIDVRPGDNGSGRTVLFSFYFPNPSGKWERVTKTFVCPEFNKDKTSCLFGLQLNPNAQKNAYLKIRKICLAEGDSNEWAPAASEMEGAVVYQIEPSVDNITKSMTGKLSATSVSCSVYKVTGDSPRELTSDKQVKCLKIKTDGTTIESTLTPTNGVTSAQTVTEDTEALVFTLIDGSTVLDSERVPVLSDASDIEVGTRNLISDSKSLTISNPSNNPYANSYMKITSPLESGKDYVVWVKRATGGQYGTLLKNERILICLSVYDSNKNLNNVSNDVWESSKGYVRIKPTVNIPAGSLLRFYAGVPGENHSIPNSVKLQEIMLVRGNVVPTDWTAAPEDIEKAIGKNDYLQDALKEDAKTTGGLILASTVSLGQNNTDYTSQTTWSGINGIYKKEAVGGGIAAWYGGDMYDLAEYYDWSDSEATWKPKSGVTIPSRIAKGVDRMDGSGYKARGSLWWDNSGNLYANGNFTGFLTVGVKNGQRIELDPIQKVMNIFGTDGGLVATHSGRILKVSEAQPTNTSGSSGTASSSGLGTSFSSPSSKTLEAQICSGTAGNSGVLVINMPVFTLSASASGGSSTTLMPLASIALYLVVTVGADTMRYYLGGVSSSGASETAKTTGKSYRIPVPKGSKYTAKLVSECRLTGPSVCTGTLGCSSSGVDYDLTTQAYRCEYGANGWVISTDSKNYAYLIVENGTLHFKVVSSGQVVAGG